jgi:hypothetical protein
MANPCARIGPRSSRGRSRGAPYRNGLADAADEGWIGVSGQRRYGGGHERKRSPREPILLHTNGGETLGSRLLMGRPATCKARISDEFERCVHPTIS